MKTRPVIPEISTNNFVILNRKLFLYYSNESLAVSEILCIFFKNRSLVYINGFALALEFYYFLEICRVKDYFHVSTHV